MKRLHKSFLLVALFVCLIFTGFVFAEESQIEIDEELLKSIAAQFPNSVLSEEEKIKELEWFARTSAPFKGMTISSVGEPIPTIIWENEVLAPLFEKLTGIKVMSDAIDEGMVVETFYRQIASKQHIYDIYINDTDLLGTHMRKQSCVNLTEFMANEGKDFTNPYQDFDDYLNLEFGQDYDGNQLQLPDNQFVNLYIFRYDWFNDPKYQAMFKEKYGYELGVPLNWAAYEDIANFWTNDVNEINGVKIYGNQDYGKPSPHLGWRITDAWLSIAGVGDKGVPFGYPVDDWGLRAEDKIPKGFSVSRGGELNGPAAVYAVDKYIEWMKKYAPPAAVALDCFESADIFGGGNIAQQISMYTCFLASDAYRSPESPVTDENGNPLWRLAPTPHGKYWEEGMKIGYQDCGAWTIPVTTDPEKRKAAWLWAQFCTCKTVDVEKFIAGVTPIRKSTVWSDWATENEGRLGGLITFYKSPMEDKFTPTGPNVPDYALLAEQFWHYISPAATGELTVEEAMDQLAAKCDSLLEKLKTPALSPQLNEEKDDSYWLEAPGSPKAKIEEEEEPRTMPYDEMLERWKAGETTF
jgi:glycerol transport system substrate-binding protein